MLGWTPIAAAPTADEYELLLDRLGASDSGAGSSAAKRRRRIQVEIDGEVLEVSSAEEAHAILDEVRKQAEETAALAIERASKARRRPVRRIVADARKALVVPEIKAPEYMREAVSSLVQQIKSDYQSAMSSIEIAAQMAFIDRQIEEDDEEILLLL